MISIVPLLLLSVCYFCDEPQAAIDPALAGRYFAEAERLWQKDAGQLWGKPLNGPLLFVNPRDRSVVASQADSQGQLKPNGSVFVGHLPPSVPPANTSVTWAGVQWIMVLWPLPKDRDARSVLMMHESWHRVQAGLGLPAQNPAITHLDTLEGRYWLQLELRALSVALRQRTERTELGDPGSALEAITDALCFRRHRQRIFSSEAAKELALEMNEGLAEYTGIKLSGMSRPEQIRYVIRKLENGPANVSSFIRNFAYWTGPAYGLLIDSQSKDWLRQLKSTSDLSAVVQKAFTAKLPEMTGRELEQRALRYQTGELRAKEETRERIRKDRVAQAQAKFIDGPVLTLPLEKMQFSFPYSELLPLEPHGIVYPNLQLTDLWGTITVKNGALMGSDFKSLRVSAPTSTGDPIAGDWSLTLKPGWKLVPAEKKGSYRVSNQ